MSVPRYRSALSAKLPPAKLPLFRSVVSHPPSPFAVETSNQAKEQASKGKGKGKSKVSHVISLILFLSQGISSNDPLPTIWNDPRSSCTSKLIVIYFCRAGNPFSTASGSPFNLLFDFSSTSHPFDNFSRQSQTVEPSCARLDTEQISREG